VRTQPILPDLSARVARGCQNGQNKWSNEVGRSISIQGTLSVHARRRRSHRAASARGQARQATGACHTEQRCEHRTPSEHFAWNGRIPGRYHCTHGARCYLVVASAKAEKRDQTALTSALLDTHALLWWVSAPKRLSTAQRRAVSKASDAGQLWVSEITFWEIASLVERGRVRLGLSIDDWLERAAAEPLVRRCGISPAIANELARLAVTLDWDPADRIIVATARVLGAILVTCDSRIIDSALVATV
jgi:PIN domain nuclease of toxin-antitoxin system